MKRVKVVGLTSFSSVGISFYPGMEAEIDEENAKNWIEAGYVKKMNDDIEDAQIVEETKELTPEELERQNLEAIAKQYGIEVVDVLKDVILSNDEIEDLIHEAITKKKEARAVNTNESSENTENKDENTNEDTENADVPKKGKKAQATAE